MQVLKHPTFDEAWASYEDARKHVENSPKAQELLKVWEEMEEEKELCKF